MARKRKEISEAQVRIAIEMHEAGDSLSEIGKVLQCSSAVVRRTLVDHNVTIRHQGRPRKTITLD